MSVVVTGGSGLLGSALVRQLLAKGVKRPVVMGRSRSPDRLDDILDEIEYIDGDLGCFSTTLNVVKQHRPTTIYHIAAMLGQVAEEEPAGAIRVNVMGTFYLMEAARLFEVPQLLFSSSISIFGEGIEDEPEFRDNLLQRPMSFYGLTKQFNEGTGLFFKRKYGLDYRSIRYPSIVGPGLREGGIMNFPAAMIEYAVKGESYTVDAEPATKIAVIHIDDAVRGMIELSRQPQARRLHQTHHPLDHLFVIPLAGRALQHLPDQLVVHGLGPVVTGVAIGRGLRSPGRFRSTVII